MGFFGAAVEGLIKMAISNLPAAWWYLRKQRIDPILLETTAEHIRQLSEPARVVLWHLCGASQTPEGCARVLREARLPANVDRVLAELSVAGLIDHDFAGARFVKVELRDAVRQILRK